jgi:hypothetical protein
MVGLEDTDNPCAERSRELLAGKAKFAFDEWSQAAFDTKVYEAEVEVSLLMSDWNALVRAIRPTPGSRVGGADRRVENLGSSEQD